MDGAILVIAATDGTMPQTREHLLLAKQVRYNCTGFLGHLVYHIRNKQWNPPYFDHCYSCYDNMIDMTVTGNHLGITEYWVCYTFVGMPPLSYGIVGMPPLSYGIFGMPPLSYGIASSLLYVNTDCF